VKVKVYVEGGGHTDAQHTQFRAGWTTFFTKAELKRRPQTVCCGSRGRAFDRFRTAVQAEPDVVHLLLVDSEDTVAAGKSNWQHLKERNDDKFDKPPAAGADDAHLMICAMETWFMADREALKTFFPGLNENRLPAWKDLERVPKKDVDAALKGATKDCEQPYSKGRLSFVLLGKINPSEVERQCPAAKRLLDRLRELFA
jgi:hypothetical protein